MEPSPLTQQSRPDTFQPKIVRLYESLFKEEEISKSDGFWQEFFLLKPDPKNLRSILSGLSADDLLHFQAHPQEFVLRSLSRVRANLEPADENALETLTVFLTSVLSKRYTNPSSDIISILAGLHDADAVFSDLVTTLDNVIRNGRSVQLRQKAVYAALAMVSGAYSTGLVSYFTHRDLFPSLMKFVQDSDDSSKNFEPFILLGLLANYNKFEFQNPYKTRLDDFVNESAIKRIVYSIGATCASARDKYVAVQDDLPEGWTFGSTLASVGLGAFTSGRKPTAPTLSAEEMKVRFTALPGPEAAVLLPTYDFANANKIFSFNFVTLPAENKSQPSPINSFLSLTSYLFQHTHRSIRGAQYTYLSLFTLQTVMEDQVLAKRISSDESKANVRLCRQRQPFLPVVRGDRILATVILDIMIDGINHNLRRRLDMDFYISCLGILLRMISYLGRSKTRLTYHWAELWRSLLSFIRFLTTYSNDIKSIPKAAVMLNVLVNLNGLALSSGEAFLPDAGAYDDLFYKLVEAGDILIKFRDTYEKELVNPKSGAIDSLISVSRHYHTLLEDSNKSRPKGKHLSAREVQRIIQQGYETLSIQAKEGLDHWDRFREADEKTSLKKAARIAIEDVKDLLASR
ncbi:DUF1741-domain-containing protein [Microthyrium microscopicum]|uniref:DUF1741-domain-containing protein n=1 Tax=Microthyrium microscopicum TaxID=703497 RepID=A0A6A6U607_9PEZI|nr:DUF1741-domain-containing protein [Microthyrium microscopicum]